MVPTKVRSLEVHSYDFYCSKASAVCSNGDIEFGHPVTRSQGRSCLSGRPLSDYKINNSNYLIFSKSLKCLHAFV